MPHFFLTPLAIQISLPYTPSVTELFQKYPDIIIKWDPTTFGFDVYNSHKNIKTEESPLYINNANNNSNILIDVFEATHYKNFFNWIDNKHLIEKIKKDLNYSGNTSQWIIYFTRHSLYYLPRHFAKNSSENATLFDIKNSPFGKYSSKKEGDILPFLNVYSPPSSAHRQFNKLKEIKNLLERIINITRVHDSYTLEDIIQISS
jgi:hypothetical protein